MNFSARLNAAIKSDGRAKKAIAAAIGVHAPVLSRWLNGVQPDARYVAKIASVLNVSIQWLMNGEGKMEFVASPLQPTAVVHENASAYTVESDWMKRAIAAEKEVAALRHTLTALKRAFHEITGPSDAPYRDVRYLGRPQEKKDCALARNSPEDCPIVDSFNHTTKPT